MKKLISEIPFLVWLLISLIWINNRDLILRGKFILTIVWTAIILWIWYRFFRKKEAKAQEPKSDEPLLETPDSFVIPLKDNGSLHLRNIQNGIMIIGQPGSGKTASIIHPILYQVINKDWTGLVYDLKGKLGDEVISCYDSIIDKSNQKTALKFINFSNPFKSDRVNPISPSYLNNKAEALDFVGTLLSNLMANDGSKSEDPFWFNNAKNIFTSIVWFLKNNHPQFCTLPHAIALVYADPDALIRLLQSDEESSRLLSTLRASSEAKDKKLFVNILSTLYTHLMALDLPELFWVLSGDEVNLNVNSKENPTLLTIANHEPLQKVYSPIIAVICNVVTQRMNEEGKLKGVILFDEFASIKIPNFERIPETIRSRGVSTVIALHDKQQLITKYGESIAETIASTLATKFYFKSTNSKTVYEAVKILGKRDTRFNTKSQSTADGVQGQTNTVGMSETLQERDYLRIDEITNYDRGEFAGIFSDANIKYTKNQTVLLRELASRGAVPIRNDVTTEMIESNYKKVYQDIEELFKNDSYDHQPSAEEIKIDF